MPGCVLLVASTATEGTIVAFDRHTARLQIKSALVVEKYLPINAFKITTKRKIIYSQGIASTQEVHAAS